MVYQKLQKSSAKISPTQRTFQAPRPSTKRKPTEDAPQQDIQRSPSNSNRLGRISVYPATLEAPVLQPKLTVGAPNDRYEKEADQVAHQVVTKIHSPAFQAPSLKRMNPFSGRLDPVLVSGGNPLLKGKPQKQPLI